MGLKSWLIKKAIEREGKKMLEKLEARPPEDKMDIKFCILISLLFFGFTSYDRNLLIDSTNNNELCLYDYIHKVEDCDEKKYNPTFNVMTTTCKGNHHIEKNKLICKKEGRWIQMVNDDLIEYYPCTNASCDSVTVR